MTHLLNEEMSNFLQKWYWGYHTCKECGSQYCSWHQGLNGKLSVVCDNCECKENNVDYRDVEPIEVEDEILEVED